MNTLAVEHELAATAKSHLVDGAKEGLDNVT